MPPACLCPAGLRRLLLSRTFQAGMKLYLAMGSTLVVTMVLMAYVPAVRDVAPIFGFTSVCLSMQERVEATADKVRCGNASVYNQPPWSMPVQQCPLPDGVPVNCRVQGKTACQPLLSARTVLSVLHGCSTCGASWLWKLNLARATDTFLLACNCGVANGLLYLICTCTLDCSSVLEQRWCL